MVLFRFAPVLPAVVALGVAQPPAVSDITIWHGGNQRVGHLGNAQDDFNVLGRIERWREIDTLSWKLNQQPAVPLSFRAYRRLVDDGDFNADVPIARLRPGANEVVITAQLRDGAMLSRTVTVHKESGARPLPFTIRWRDVKNPQDVGQYVDGRWELTPQGLRTTQIGYDRLFLIGNRTWRDYDVRTTFTVHAVTGLVTNGAGVGLIARFAGHVTGGPENFPSGQPKWGYRPFGAIAWLRWRGAPPNLPEPQKQFYPGANARFKDLGPFAFQREVTYGIRLACRTLPDDAEGKGVTEYRCKLWPAGEPEPSEWSWQETQVSRDALRAGGVAFVAHFADVTFGDVVVSELRR